MDVQKHLYVLQIHLLAMSRLSQRALDYSIKGFELGCPRICGHVSSAEHELDEHHLKVNQLCRKLMTTAVTAPSDLRFILATLRIDNALHATSRAAAQIAQETILFLESSPMVKCPALNRLGEFVNCSMRLCIVALFKKDVVHAQTVIQSQAVWRRCEMVFDDARDDVKYRMEAQDIYALTIAGILGVIAKQAHEIADAILFWLKGSDDAFALEEDGQDTLSLLFTGCSTSIEIKSQLPTIHHSAPMTLNFGIPP